MAQPVSNEKQASVVYCYRCGRPRLRNAPFCATCGSGLNDLVAGQAASAHVAALPGPVVLEPTPASLGRRLRRNLGVPLAVVLAGVVLAFFSYQAGRSDLLAGFGGSDLQARFVQIGNDTPGQPFGLAVDNFSADVTVAQAPQPSDEQQCPVDSTITDDFESGAFPNNAFVGIANDGQAVVQQTTKHQGAFAALVSSTDSKGSYAYVRFGVCPGTALDVSADFWIEREGSLTGNVPIFRIFRQDGTRIMSVYRQNGAGDRLFIQVGGDYRQTIGRLPMHTWSTIELHASYPKGIVRVIELLVDGRLVYNSSH